MQLWDRLDKEVVEFAADTARPFSAEILFLYVFPGFVEYSSVTIITEEASKAVLQDAKIRMDQLLKNSTLEGLQFRTLFEEGVPVDKILEVAEKEKADLIVMGTHGRRGMDQFFFGSVTEKIVRMSPTPVLTIRPKD